MKELGTLSGKLIKVSNKVCNLSSRLDLIFQDKKTYNIDKNTGWWYGPPEYRQFFPCKTMWSKSNGYATKDYAVLKFDIKFSFFSMAGTDYGHILIGPSKNGYTDTPITKLYIYDSREGGYGYAHVVPQKWSPLSPGWSGLKFGDCYFEPDSSMGGTYWLQEAGQTMGVYTGNGKLWMDYGWGARYDKVWRTDYSLRNQWNTYKFIEEKNSDFIKIFLNGVYLGEAKLFSNALHGEGSESCIRIYVDDWTGINSTFISYRNLALVETNNLQEAMEF